MSPIHRLPVLMPAPLRTPSFFMKINWQSEKNLSAYQYIKRQIEATRKSIAGAVDSQLSPHPWWAELRVFGRADGSLPNSHLFISNDHKSQWVTNDPPSSQQAHIHMQEEMQTCAYSNTHTHTTTISAVSAVITGHYYVWISNNLTLHVLQSDQIGYISSLEVFSHVWQKAKAHWRNGGIHNMQTNKKNKTVVKENLINRRNECLYEWEQVMTILTSKPKESRKETWRWWQRRRQLPLILINTNKNFRTFF